MPSKDPRLNRRSLLAAASAFAASPLLASQVTARPTTILFQDATPPVSATPEVEASGPTIPPEFDGQSDTDWLTEGRTLQMERAVPGSNISSESVADLAESWTFGIEGAGPYGALTSNPLVHGDTLYLLDANSNLYALDRETGEEHWRHANDQPIPAGGPNGMAIGYGKMAYQAGKSEVVLIDLETGDEIWRTDIEGPRGEGITLAPLIYDNKVWTSTIPGTVDEGFYKGGMRGVLHVLDIADGSVLWTFDTVVDNLWGNPSVNSGGGIWHPPTVGKDGDLFFAIANAAPYPGVEDWPSASSRPGDNDYANNVLKIDNETGGLIWNVNITGRDVFDLDNHLSPIYGTVEFEDGYTRDLVFTSGKHGYVVALDPVSGAQHWRTPVGTHRNAHLQEIPEGEVVEVWPGTFGGVETPIAYADNVVFVPIFENPTNYEPEGISGGIDFSQAVGKFAALDARNGNVLWEVDVQSGVLGGATVVNDLVFTGSLDGRVRAYNVTDGSLAWSAQATAGLNAPFAISGDYVYVPAGGPLLPSDETEEVAEPKPQLIAYKLG